MQVHYQKPVLYSALKDVYGTYDYGFEERSIVGADWQMIWTAGQFGQVSLVIERYTSTKGAKSALTAGFAQLPDLAIGGEVNEVFYKVMHGPKGTSYPKYVIIFKEEMQYKDGCNWRGPLLQYPDIIQDLYGLPDNATWLDTVNFQALIYSTTLGVTGWFQLGCFSIDVTLV